MANTVETLGDAELVKQILNKTITEYEDNIISKIGHYAFYKCTALTTVKSPSCESIGDYAFYGCTSLKKVDLEACSAIYMSFQECIALEALILRKSDGVCSLTAPSAFSNTPIVSGTGYIYVPSALVDSYKSATYWSDHANQIRAIEDYPEVCDPYNWETVFKTIEAGTYKDFYKVGDCIPLDLGSEGIINMQIVAFDKDDLADGSGKAPISWLSEQLLNTSRRMNRSLVANYDESTKNAWAQNDSGEWESQNQGTGSTSAIATWTITATEAGTVTVSYKVGSELNYDKLTVTVNGETVANAISGTVDWTDHAVECVAGDTVTVKAIYSKDGSGDKNGDTGYVKFSSTGAFDFVSDIATLTIEAVRDYQEGTGTIGGWEKSEMRSYINDTVKPLIPDPVASAIKAVTKTHRAYNTANTEFTQTTTDEVWIPSYIEMHDASGLYYDMFQNTSSKRIKKNVGASNATFWWLRSASDSSNFDAVTASGHYGNSSANGSYGVAIGFCT